MKGVAEHAHQIREQTREQLEQVVFHKSQEVEEDDQIEIVRHSTPTLQHGLLIALSPGHTKFSWGKMCGLKKFFPHNYPMKNFLHTKHREGSL